MVAKYGSPAEKATVRRKVHAKYPSMGTSSHHEAYAYDWRKQGR